MGSRPPKGLDATAIERCARIAGIQRRDLFDPSLVRLVTAACRWNEQRRQVAVDRAKIANIGRVFAKALRQAQPEAKREIEALLPNGVASLSVALDAMAGRAGPRARDAHWNAKIIILLCASVERAGGRLTINEKTREGSLIALLDVLKPYLPLGFIPASAHTLRELKTSAAHLARNIPA